MKAHAKRSPNKHIIDTRSRFLYTSARGYLVCFWGEGFLVYFFSLFFSFIATLSAFADTDSLRARIRDIACAEILKVEDIQFREFNDAPGFFMLDSAVPKGLTSVVELRKLTMSKNFSGFTLHELDSAAAYARIVFRSRGERVV
ncbi:MAG TPA: hypothetical protein PLH57_10720, partial [Oligoflexia bacterium]|nr:hypothetical protein [Oligoflexia bacterium]